MNQELEANLVSRYPILYSRRDLSMQETCMCWGFECGNGWFDIINTLSCELETINRRIARRKERDDRIKLMLSLVMAYSFSSFFTCGILMVTGEGNHPVMAGCVGIVGLLSLWWMLRIRRRHYPFVEATQVKEKFGTLRFYLDTPLGDEIDALVDKAEAASGVTCEACGCPGSLRCRKGWYSTLCDDCSSR